jgi:hypothetical protein
MNCHTTQTRLVEWLYGELSEQEEARLREHLGECDSCRSEADKLRRSLQLLELAPETRSRVDAGGVYRRAANRSEKSRRRWRRAALAACAAVLVVGAVAFGRLRIESHAGCLVLSWGNRPAADVAEESPAEPVVEEISAAPDVPPDPWPTLRRHGERLETLDELAQLLVAEVDSADRRRRVDVAGLERKLKEIERQIARQWYVFDRDVKAVYQLAQNHPVTEREGAQP